MFGSIPEVSTHRLSFDYYMSGSVANVLSLCCYDKKYIWTVLPVEGHAVPYLHWHNFFK
jgi:hypothetical protein